MPLTQLAIQISESTRLVSVQFLGLFAFESAGLSLFLGQELLFPQYIVKTAFRGLPDGQENCLNQGR